MQENLIVLGVHIPLKMFLKTSEPSIHVFSTVLTHSNEKYQIRYFTLKIFITFIELLHRNFLLSKIKKHKIFISFHAVQGFYPILKSF